MSSVFRDLLVVALVTMLVAGATGCEREARHFFKVRGVPDARATATAIADQQVGPAGPGMLGLAAAGPFREFNAYAQAQGKNWYRWFNCSGCHAHGGGASGPALMDQNWIYGKEPADIFTTIMDGRPNGMPSYRGRIPEEQAWQIVAYVRSLSGLGSSDAATNRSDSLAGGLPEYLRDPERPEDKRRR